MMRKWVVLFLIAFASLAFTQPVQERRIDPEALAELTAAFGIEGDWVAETQRRWLRKAGQERWEMAELTAEQRAFVLDWGARNHFYDDWKPGLVVYDKALILGATTSRMQQRLDYLKLLWEEGTRFAEVVWLTGERPLDKRVDGLTDRCANESEAAPILWEEAELPEQMRQLPVVYIAVPMKEENGALKRPNTHDTLVAWLEAAPAPCTALFVSDQPFCGYQYAVVGSALPDSYLYDLVGKGANPSSHPSGAAVTLDSIARWLYQSPK